MRHQSATTRRGGEASASARPADRGQTADLPPAVLALLNPEAASSATEPPKLLQTHISWVVVGDRDVVKVKKPVELGFLDFSTLERRRVACEREVELNRRLCPDVYLGVRSIREVGGRAYLADDGDERGQGRMLEYAVWMRRLPEDRLLDRLVAEGTATSGMVEDVADRLSSFHATAATGPGIDEYGAPDALRANAEENFEQVRPYIGRSIDEAAWTSLRKVTLRFLDTRRDLIERRVRDGRIRDGHGDLHTGNICMSEPVAIFDCIEFNDRFRCGDVASEVAFLAMDLRSKDRPDLAAAFVERYQQMSGDRNLRLVLDYYGCYRAYVRGKVESMKLEEPEFGEAERAEAIRRARGYFELAADYARRMLAS